MTEFHLQYFLNKLQYDQEFRAELPDWYKQRFEDDNFKEEKLKDEVLPETDFGFSEPL